MKKVEKDALRLLSSLRVESPAAAADGPGDPDMLELLTYPKRSNEDLVLQLVESVAELARLAHEAADEVTKLDKLIGVKNNAGGERAVNDWIAEMMTLYRKITGREPGTSVGGPEGPNPGAEGGPFLRFLEAAGRPLGIENTPAGWRGQVRFIRSVSQKQN